METTEATTTVQTPDTARADTPHETTETEPKSVPLSVLHKVREEANAAKAKLAELEAAQRKQEEEAAAKRGEFQSLYTEAKTELEKAREELESYRTRESERIEGIKSANADRIANLPAEFRELVPDGLDPETTSTHLDRLERIANAAPAKPQTFPPGGRASGQGADPEELTPEVQAWVESDAQHLRGVSPRVVRMHFNKFGPGKVVS